MNKTNIYINMVVYHSEKLARLTQENASLKGGNEELVELIEMRSSEMESVKQALGREKAGNSRMLITLKSIEQTVADLKAKQMEEADTMTAKIENVNLNFKEKSLKFDNFLKGSTGKSFCYFFIH
jgi:predicted S18 family serine protease